MTVRVDGLGLLVVILAGVLGCGRSDAPPNATTYSVSGDVTLDGKPVEKGFIQFVSESDVAAGVPSGGGEIIDGKYSLEATLGAKQVRIRAPQETGEPDVTGLVPTVETIPPRYNDNTELSAEVTDDGSNEFNFQLQSS